MNRLTGFILSFLAGFGSVALAGQAVTVYGDKYSQAATVSPLGEMRVENPAAQIFVDTFDTGTLDITNRWTASNGGTGVLPSNAVGATVLNGGTTANSFSKLVSQPTFQPTEPGYLLFNARVNLQSPVPTANVADWGLGTSGASPTFAAPITQCVCFEVLNGKLAAVVYQTGTRVVIQDLSVPGPQGGVAPQPTDAAAHKYFIYFRGDNAYWTIDDKDNVVAQFNTGALGPDINSLNMLFQVVSNAGSAQTLQVNAASLGDTSHTASRGVDGTFGWRNQSIGPRGDAIESFMDGNKATYSAATSAAAGVAGDTVVLTGSASKVTRILRACVSGYATAAASIVAQAIKRTTADTGGTTGTAPTIVKHDTNNVAATDTIALYTAAPTAGTGAPARSDKLFVTAVGTPAQEQDQCWSFGQGPEQGIVLRGVAEQFAVNLSAAPAGGSFDIDVEWTEE